MADFYSPCGLCPRNCGAFRGRDGQSGGDRAGGRRGFCGETAELRIASASIHRGEEPPITGAGGSGTIFISGCTLGCKFCQNWQISQGGMGRTVTEQEFIRLCLALQELGAENINIVTGSHAAPALASGIGAARKQGLRIPVLWNSSAYEGLEALALLEEAVEVWLPDLKTLDSGISASLFKAPDYPEQATAAILRMMEYRGRLRFGKPQGSLGGGYTGPVLVSGVIIRHLVLPGFLESTREVLRWFAEYGRTRALLSLMTQYTPVNSAGEVPDRYVSQSEYDTVLGWLEEFEIEDGFFQELVPDSGWLPDFTRENPFSSDLSLPVWHWKKGMLINL